jgi:hypothetical protein
MTNRTSTVARATHRGVLVEPDIVQFPSRKIAGRTHNRGGRPRRLWSPHRVAPVLLNVERELEAKDEKTDGIQHILSFLGPSFPGLQNEAYGGQQRGQGKPAVLKIHDVHSRMVVMLVT